MVCEVEGIVGRMIFGVSAGRVAQYHGCQCVVLYDAFGWPVLIATSPSADGHTWAETHRKKRYPRSGSKFSYCISDFIDLIGWPILVALDFICQCGNIVILVSYSRRHDRSSTKVGTSIPERQGKAVSGSAVPIRLGNPVIPEQEPKASICCKVRGDSKSTSHQIRWVIALFQP